MAGGETFQFDKTEGRKLRRGAFLPILLILPLASMFAFDSSKSQPLHFIMTFGMGIIVSAVVVGISRAGANRRIEDLSRTTLSLLESKLVWHSPVGDSTMALRRISKVTVRQRRGRVRSIVLQQRDGKRVVLEGYERMDVLAQGILKHFQPGDVHYQRWLHI